MEEELRARLAEAAGVSALVGERVQWAVREDAPSVALHLIDAPPDWTLKGPSGLVQARVQIDCWADTFLGAKAIGDAVRAALPPIGAVLGAVKFHSCVVLDTDRGRFGESPNILHRTRIDVRVSYSPA
jgi:hypothetical protein